MNECEEMLKEVETLEGHLCWLCCGAYNITLGCLLHKDLLQPAAAGLLKQLILTEVMNQVMKRNE